jgi:hypothetical protein
MLISSAGAGKTVLVDPSTGEMFDKFNFCDHSRSMHLNACSAPSGREENETSIRSVYHFGFGRLHGTTINATDRGCARNSADNAGQLRRRIGSQHDDGLRWNVDC